MPANQKTAVAFLAVAALAAGAVLSHVILKANRTVSAQTTIYPTPRPLPDFCLTDHEGNAFCDDQLDDHWTLMFFGFTHCPDICPLTLQVLANAKQQLAASGHEPLPRIVLVSVDPERDTPGILGRYVKYFGADNLGITGELHELRKLTGGLGIFFEKSEQDGDNYGVDHSAVVIVINPDGRFQALFGAPHDANNFANDLPIIMGTQ